MKEPTSVYRFYNEHDLLLYVGITSQGTQRFTQHRAEKDWWPEVSRIEVENFQTREEALHRETEIIRQECPLYNRKAGRLVSDPFWGTRWRVFLGGPAHRKIDSGDYEWRLYLWQWFLKPNAPIGGQIPPDSACRQSRYKYLGSAGRTDYYLFDDWGGWGTDDPQFEYEGTREDWLAEQAIVL